MLLEFGEEVFNQMPGLVEGLIRRPLVETIGFGREDNGHLRLFKHCNHSVLGLLRLIGEQGGNLVHESGQESLSSVEV